jgi:hypothetical protein
MYYVYLLLMYWNICKFLFFLPLFYLYCHFGYRKGEYRNYYTNQMGKYLYYAIKYGINKRIVYTNHFHIQLEKVNLINANHFHPFDFIIMLHFFKMNKIKGESISSISITDDIFNLEKKVFKLMESCIVKKKNTIIQNCENIKKSVVKWLIRDFPTLIIFFAEGITRIDTLKRKKNVIDYVGKPQYLGLQTYISSSKKKCKYLHDLNIVYTFQNKIVNSGTHHDFINKFFHPDFKIYVEVNKYQLPEPSDCSNWIKELYKLKNKQIQQIITKYNIST